MIGIIAEKVPPPVRESHSQGFGGNQFTAIARVQAGNSSVRAQFGGSDRPLLSAPTTAFWLLLRNGVVYCVTIETRRPGVFPSPSLLSGKVRVRLSHSIRKGNQFDPAVTRRPG
jgi:hypothetical protein